MSDTVYIRISQNVRVKEAEVFLGRIADIWCKDKSILSRCMALKLFQADKPGHYIYSILDVVKLIQQNYPGVDVENLGEEDFIVEYMADKKRHAVWEWVKLVLTWIVIFCGAAFAIMTFNEDVSIKEVFGHVHELITGGEAAGFTVIEGGYALGLVVGILVFFNHFSIKKSISDPTPLEVEMRKYEDEMYTAIIENKDRCGKDEQQV